MWCFAHRPNHRPAAWEGRILARKPRMVVAIARANKMARPIRTMLTKKENYRDPVSATT